jgi:3-dehydroquinate dehydratase-2
MKILIINGPNLNRLGKRNPAIYGNKSLDETNQYIQDHFKRVQLTFFQSNYEGEIIDQLQKSAGQFGGVVINPGAYGHYSLAIRDAIEDCGIPVAEVHISNIAAREEFRQRSVISEVCCGAISGFGIYGYVLAVQALAHQLKSQTNEFSD